MKKHVDVVGALIKKDNKFFVCQRSSEMSLPLMWEFPGGKIETGESEEEALVREIREELSCSIKVIRHIDKSYYEYDTFTIDLSVHECELTGDNSPVIEEHSDYAWITVDQFDDYDFAPADIPAINVIKELYAK